MRQVLLEANSDEDFNRNRTYQIVELVVRRGQFRKYEGDCLISGLRKYGWDSWALIAKNFGDDDAPHTRTAVSLKEIARALNLDPDEYVFLYGMLEPRKQQPVGKPQPKGEKER